MNFRDSVPEIENNMSKITSIQLFKNIKTLVEQSKQELYAVANVTLTETYFHTGRLIVEYEQQGSNRARGAKACTNTSARPDVLRRILASSV